MIVQYKRLGNDCNLWRGHGTWSTTNLGHNWMIAFYWRRCTKSVQTIFFWILCFEENEHFQSVQRVRFQKFWILMTKCFFIIISLILEKIRSHKRKYIFLSKTRKTFIIHLKSLFQGIRKKLKYMRKKHCKK